MELCVGMCESVYVRQCACPVREFLCEWTWACLLNFLPSPFLGPWMTYQTTNRSDITEPSLLAFLCHTCHGGIAHRASTDISTNYYKKGCVEQLGGIPLSLDGGRFRDDYLNKRDHLQIS